MREFDATDRMPATKEIVFDELSRSGLLDRWVPEGVRGKPDVRSVPEQCRAEWSGRQGEEYAGFVEVRDSGAGASEVTVHVAMGDGVPDPRSGTLLAADLAESLRDLYEAVSKRVTSP